MKAESEIKKLLQQALQNKGFDTAKLKDLTIEEVLETLSIYQQELEYQNMELAQSYERVESISRRYQELFDNAPIAYLVLNTEAEVIACNSMAEKLLRQSKRAILGKPVSLFVASDYQDAWYLFLRKAWASGENTSLELAFLTKEGQLYADIQCQCAVDDDTKEKILRLSLTDITAKKEAELELKLAHELLLLEKQKIEENAMRLRQVHKIADLGFWEYEHKSGILSWSSEMFELMGLSFSQFNGQLDDMLAAILPEDKLKFQQAFQAHKITGEDIEISYRISSKDGNARHLLLHAHKSTNSTMDDQRSLGTVIDVSNLKKAEERAAKNLTQFNAIARSIEEVFWLRDAKNQTLLYVSPAFENMFGVSLKSFYEGNSEFLTRVHPDDYLMVKDRMELRPLTQGHDQVYRINHPQRGLRWIHSKSGPVFNEQGELVNFSGIALDITESKQKELELINLSRMLEETANLAKIGSFELELSTGKLTWSKQTRIIHEVDDSYVPDMQSSLAFFDSAFSRGIVDRAGNNAIEAGIDFDLELVINTAKGNRKWVRVIGKTDFVDGTCTKLFGTMQDIHHLRLFEEALQKEKDRLNNVLEGTNVGTWEWNIQSGETIFNERWAAILGYTLTDLFPTTIQTFDKLCHPDDIDRVNKTLQEYFNGEKEFYEAEYRMLHKDGTAVWILDKGKVFEYTKEGKPLLMAGTHQDITQRKLNEIRINQMSLAVEQSSASIVITNLIGEIEYVNPKFCEVTGYSKEEAIGQNPRILKSGNKSLEEYQFLWKKLTSGETWTGEFLNKKKDGSLYWEQASINPLKNSLGEITHFVAVKEDISAKKEALQKLEESEKKYRQISENMSDMVFTTDTKLFLTYVSPSSFKVFGVSPEEFKKDALVKHFTPESSQIIQNQLQQILTFDKPISNLPVTELEAIHKSGKTIWVQIKIEPILDNNNELQGYLGVCSDISKRKKAEQDLRENEYFLGDLINFSGASVYVKDLEGRYVQVNKQFETSAGLHSDSIIGKTDFDLFPEDVAMLFNQNDSQVITEGRTIQVEEWHPEKWIVGKQSEAKDGKRFFFSNKFPVRNALGKITGVAGVSFEITQLKKIEQELDASQTRYRELFENSPIGKATVSSSQQVLMVNQKFTEITGYTLSEVPDVASWHKLAYPDETYRIAMQQKRMRLIQDAENNNSAYVSLEAKVRCKDGSYKHLDIGYMNFREYAVFTFIDVSSRVKAVLELRQSEQRFRNLFEANASPMYLLDASSLKIVDVNNAALNFYGFERTEFLNLKLNNLNSNSDEVVIKLRKLRNEKHIRTETKHRLKDGSIRDVEVFSTLLDSGNIELVHEIVHDITERNQYFDALENQNKVMRDIAWTQSHVVRAPLARLMGLMDVFLEKDFSILPEKELINALGDSANELDKIIRNIAEKTYVVNNLAQGTSRITELDKRESFAKTQEVLLVDDDQMIQVIHKKLVQKSGLSAEPGMFSNGLDALQYLQKNNHERFRFLIFLDINMPKMNGWELLEELNKVPFNCEILVIILTSSVEIQDRLKAQKYPQVIDYITKPISATSFSELRTHPRLKGLT